MSKFGLAALAVIAALVVSFSFRASTPEAEANVTATRAVWCGFLIGAIDGNPDNPVVAADITNACNGISEAEVALLATGIGNESAPLTASDLDDAQAFGGNQVSVSGTSGSFAIPLTAIYIFAFVDDDAAVTFDAEAGVSVAVNDDLGTDDAVPAPEAPTDDPETCAGNQDEDCGTTVTTDGDGVVVATVTWTTASEGAEIDVDISQEGVEETQTLNIVGAAFEVTITLVETTIQSDAAASCDAGTDPVVTDSAALGDPESTIAIGVVSDNDDRPLTRVQTVFSSSEAGVADIGDDTVFSVDAGDSGVAAFAVVCGDGTGTADITATIGTDDDSAEITVVGEPATVVLAASPAQIACDGTQTSTVTATVTDSDGNNVANGTQVTFSVVALGTANPINVDTTDGTASSTITPLSGATAGVTVVVTAGGTASASIRVDCSLPIPTVVPPGATATPPGGITPPSTGNGGYLGQDSTAGFPLWTLVALALGSFALVAGGMVTRRVGR